MCTCYDVYAALLLSPVVWVPAGIIVWYRWGTHVYDDKKLPPPDNGRRTS